MQWHIRKMKNRIAHGESNIGSILDTGLFNPQSIQTFKILGEIGEHTDTLAHSGNFHGEILEESMYRIRVWGSNIIKIVGLIIGLVMGGGIASLITDMATNIHI